jgi:hypothetical protein
MLPLPTMRSAMDPRRVGLGGVRPSVTLVSSEALRTGWNVSSAATARFSIGIRIGPPLGGLTTRGTEGNGALTGATTGPGTARVAAISADATCDETD